MGIRGRGGGGGGINPIVVTALNFREETSKIVSVEAASCLC